MQCLSLLLGSSNGGGHRFAAIVQLVVIGLVAIGVLSSAYQASRGEGGVAAASLSL